MKTNYLHIHITSLLYSFFNAHPLFATELYASYTDTEVQSPQSKLQYNIASSYGDVLIPKKVYPNSSKRRSKQLIGSNNWPQIGGSIQRGTIGDVCGYDVDISNDGRTVIIGCPHETVNGNEDAGSTHIYRLVSDEQSVGEDTWVKLE